MFDKEEIIRQVAQVLKETRTAQDTVRQGPGRDRRFTLLARYMIEKAIRHNALLTDDTGTGIALMFRMNAGRNHFFRDVWEDIKLAFCVIGLTNVPKIIRVRKHIRSRQPKSEPFFYMWFWGVIPGSRGAGKGVAVNMKDMFLRISEDERLPIYAETRLRTNAMVYQRYKFIHYDTWNMPGGDTMWFVRYLPKSLGR